MRLEQLQAFLAIADTSSFQRAAQKCGVSQPTISRQVQGLEAELGIALFHRGAQARLTSAGNRFLPRARRICQEWNAVTQEFAELLGGKQPELCVAVIHSACASALPPVLRQFYEDYPTVQLRVTSLGSDRALKVLRDGLVDLAIVMNNRFLTTSSELVVDFLYEEAIQVLLAAPHPLARQPVISWHHLAQYPQVMFKDGYGMQRLVQEQFQRRGLALNTTLELNTLDAFRGTVRQGNWVALLPDSALRETRLDPTLAVRRIEGPPLTRQVVLVTTQERLSIPPIQHFRTLVHAAFHGHSINTTQPPLGRPPYSPSSSPSIQLPDDSTASELPSSPFPQSSPL